MSNRQVAIDKVKEKLLTCVKCADLIPPPVSFETGPDSKVFFLARNPGFYENQELRPLIGAAGLVFNQELLRIQCDRKKVWVGNVANCYSESDRCPTPEEFLNCFPFLKACVSILKPKLMVVMGEEATKFLVPTIRWKFDRGKLRVLTIAGMRLILVPIMHPAAAVHKGSNSMKVTQDMNNVRLLLQKLPEKYWKID